MPIQYNNKRQQGSHYLKQQFGLFQDLSLSNESIVASIQDQKNYWLLKLEIQKNALEIERNKLAEILLAKDKTINLLNRRIKTQNYMQDCIQNPSKHPELKANDVEKYIKLLPENERLLTIFTNQLQARNIEHQECESNIIRLENKIAKLEYKIESSKEVLTLLVNPSAFFRTKNPAQKPSLVMNNGTQHDFYPKKRF